MAQTYNDWEKVTRSLIKNLQAQGLQLKQAHDGEDYLDSTNRAEIAGWVMQCGSGTIYFYDPEIKREVWVFVVSGNEPEELVCDHIVNDKIDSGAEEFSRIWEGKSCPTREA